MILQNAVMNTETGRCAMSNHRHCYIEFEGKAFIDGGNEYLRRGWLVEKDPKIKFIDVLSTDTIDRMVENAVWGVWVGALNTNVLVLLKMLGTPHLNAISVEIMRRLSPPGKPAIGFENIEQIYSCWRLLVIARILELRKNGTLPDRLPGV